MNKLFYKDLNIRINFANVLLFVLFWSYGYFAAVTKEPFDSKLIQIVFIFYLTACTFYFFYLGREKEVLFTFVYRIKSYDLLTIFFISIFWIVLSFHKLSSPIVEDQFYYSLKSKIQEVSSIIIVSKYLY